MTDDLAALREQMETITREANANLSEEQRQITYGSYWIRFYNVADRFVIFGYVDPIDTIRSEETELGAGEQELDYLITDIERRHQNGFMYGTCFSTMVPSGEVGFTHLADLWPITEEAFTQVREVEWDIDSRDLPWDTKVLFATGYAEFQTHNIEVERAKVTEEPT